jgi:putative DNA primase/helicase
MTTRAPSRLGKSARAYAEGLGFAVFPVGPDCRTPYKVKGAYEHGCHDATKDPDEIARRWGRHPLANIALACGPVSGVFALDIDAKGDVDGFASLARLEARFSPLPRTWRSLTPSGGEHRFFRQPDGRVLRNLVGLKLDDGNGGFERYPGLDIRSAGGSVALPPSAKPHGPYAWADAPSQIALADAPAWLLSVIDPPAPQRRPSPPLRFASMDRAARYVAAAVDRECGAVAGMGAGTGRNHRLFQAAANLGELVGGNLLSQDAAEAALEQAAADCGLTKEDGPHAVRATIRSGINRGLRNPRELAA